MDQGKVSLIHISCHSSHVESLKTEIIGPDYCHFHITWRGYYMPAIMCIHTCFAYDWSVFKITARESALGNPRNWKYPPPDVEENRTFPIWPH